MPRTADHKGRDYKIEDPAEGAKRAFMKNGQKCQGTKNSSDFVVKRQLY
jgi:hypothetical protein